MKEYVFSDMVDKVKVETMNSVLLPSGKLWA